MMMDTVLWLWWLYLYIYDYSVIIIIILMVVHDHDPWVWWAQSMHSLYSAFFFRDWLSSVVPEVCFLQHVEWHSMGALRSKDLPTWMNHFAVILIGPHQRRKTYWHIVGENDMPSDLARWTKIIPIPHPYYSTPSNHGLIGDSHILIVFFCTVRIYWGLIQILLDASPSNWHTSTPFDTLWTDAGVKQGCLICAWWLWVLWRSSVSIQCPSRNMWGFGC